jgi:cation diffusion facilitator CzcD-associated flavoprotein CzcO
MVGVVAKTGDTDSPVEERVTGRPESGTRRDRRRVPRPGTPRVGILGAGAAGLCMGIQLLDAGIDSFTIFEKSDGVGGTWRDNTYPGAACDVPSHLYSLSFAPKTDWTRKFPEQPEILEYFESLVPRFGLDRHLRLGTPIESATWDDDSRTWTLRSGSGEEFEVDVLVSGLGQLNVPNIPDLPGLDTFDGTVFHSARWDHRHDLRGERVAVVGIGASAIQFVPQVAKQARRLFLFQRSVNYVVPKPDREFRPWERWMLEHVPFVQRAYRESIYWRFEARFSLMRRDSRLGRLIQDRFAKSVAALVSPRLPREALVPDYTPGCRRLLIANDWFPTLLKPHVSVITDPVEKVTPRGLVTRSGEEVVVDTIIFGTGFRTTEFLAPVDVRGRDGVSLREVWSDGAFAHLGLSVPGFPNLFMLYGPNTNLGHNSILFMIEQQVAYIRSLLETMASRGVDAAEPTPEAMATFDHEIREATERTVWAEDCHSWYKTESGRVTNNWPDFTVRYRRRLRTPDLAEWDFRGS